MEEKKPEGGAGPEPVAPIWELGDRMKEYEAANEQFLDPTLPFLGKASPIHQRANRF